MKYDDVLEVLGAVDTDIFSRMLRQVMARDVAGVLQTVEELVMQGKGTDTACGRFYMVSKELASCEKF